MTKQKSTKRSLLMSALALVMCLSMLIGSTFAWFTDSVSTGVNTIQSGTLQIDIQNAAGQSLEGQSFAFADKNGSTDILWEPGATFITPAFKIVNTGNLDLKYTLAINGITNGNAELLDVIDFYLTETDPSGYDSFGAYYAEISGDTVETVDILSGDYQDLTVAQKETNVMWLVGHMAETANNDYQGKKIEGVGLSVFATQMASETDSFDNQYDAQAPVDYIVVSTAEELYSAVAAASGDVVIAVNGNISLTKALSKSGLNSIKFVSASGSDTLNQATYNMHFAGAKVTFEGLILTHNGKPYGNGGQAATSFSVWDAVEVNYIGCTFNRSVGTIHASVHNFIGCTFNGVYNPDNALSEYPLNNYDSEETNVVDCVFNCTNRGAILFYGDNRTGEYTLNISGTSFLGDIIADKTAVEIHSLGTSTYNVNIEDVIVGSGVINGLYRIKPANEGTVNVNVDTDSVITNAEIVSTAAQLADLGAKTLTSNNNVAEEATIVLDADIDMDGAEFSSIVAQRGDKLTIVGNGHKISNVTVVSGENDNSTGQASMFYAYSGSTLTVSDLVLENITVNSDAVDSGYTAAVVGYCEGTAVLNNVDVINATVTGVKSSGMLVGHLSGTLTATDCDLSGTVTLAQFDGEPEGHYAGKYIGTLAGTATLTDCTADVTVSGSLKEGNNGDIFGRNLGTLNN